MSEMLYSRYVVLTVRLDSTTGRTHLGKVANLPENQIRFSSNYFWSQFNISILTTVTDLWYIRRVVRHLDITSYRIKSDCFSAIY